MDPIVNVWNYCFLPHLLLSHSDKNTKEGEEKRLQVALKEKEQKEQNLFKWSTRDKETAQVNQVFSSAVETTEEQVICL